YFMNRHWTWRDRIRSGVHRELPLFAAFSAVGLGIAEACLWISHDLLGYTSALADNVAANGFGLALGMVWRFLSFKKWVFTAPLVPAKPADPGATTVGPAPGDTARGRRPRKVLSRS
ncbi:MAG TPA: GtrA family protein, partial [Gemmatimonadaceae bacterium]|nr:GtrA family protein [Gemmatimonadaceae bacterium]